MKYIKHHELKCIFCKRNSVDGDNHVLTDEHIIPQVLGGWLTIPFVCKTCNNERLGSGFESTLKNNAFIVSAIDKLRLQPKGLAYRAAKIQISFDGKQGLNAYFNNKGEVKFTAQEVEDGMMLVSEGEAESVLKKQVARYERKTGKRVEFDPSKFGDMTYDTRIPVGETGISVIKKRDKKATLIISGLDQPIPFRLPAKIAFEHLAGLYYPYVMKDEFNPIREWILKEGPNTFVLLNAHLSDRKPFEINYLPYHFVRINYQSGGLSAIVGLFGIIKFLVFLGRLGHVEDFPFKDMLNNYHVYGLREKKLIPQDADVELRQRDDIFLDGVTGWGISQLQGVE